MSRQALNRRALVRAGFLAGAALLLAGHTPYGQWVVYRKKHLLIGCHKDDPRTYDLAKEVVSVLQEHLPAAKARVARAPNAGRLASLLGTDQIEVVILAPDDAAAMLEGRGGFKPYGPLPLRLLLNVGDRALIAHGDFPARHAWLVASALAGTEVAPDPGTGADAVPPWHPGSRAYLLGEAEPSD